MTRRWMIALLAGGLVLAAGLVSCGTDSAGGGGGGGDTANDRVLKGTQFTEVFKDDGNGKNYLYTITEFDNTRGEHCTVVTGDSERTIAEHCAKPGS